MTSVKTPSQFGCSLIAVNFTVFFSWKILSMQVIINISFYNFNGYYSPRYYLKNKPHPKFVHQFLAEWRIIEFVPPGFTSPRILSRKVWHVVFNKVIVVTIKCLFGCDTTSSLSFHYSIKELHFRDQRVNKKG